MIDLGQKGVHYCERLFNLKHLQNKKPSISKII